MIEPVPENSVTLPTVSDGAVPFQFMETRPSGITWHMIFDHELDDLTNISRPIVLGLATTFLGAFFGLLPTVADVADKVGAGRPIGLSGSAALLAFAVSLTAALTLGYFAARGQLDALQKKREIRSRRALPINPASRGASSEAF